MKANATSAADIEQDALVLPVLGRPAACEECRLHGLKSQLTALIALVEKVDEEHVAEVHSYSCSRGHWWNRRTRIRPMSEVVPVNVNA